MSGVERVGCVGLGVGRCGLVMVKVGMGWLILIFVVCGGGGLIRFGLFSLVWVCVG